VADAGGTQLAIVDVRPGVRQLQWRQDLPNYLVETYKVLRLAGGTQEEIIVHDVSDRPQYVATVCRVGGAPPNCASDSIYALYSTTPTQSSTSPFAGKATLRMEKLINTTNPALLFGKFLLGDRGDALQHDHRYPPHRGDPGDDEHRGALGLRRRQVRLNEFGLGDSTYARNSGNFTHAFFGEGGNASTAFARVMAYDARGRSPPRSTSAASAFRPHGPRRRHRHRGLRHVARGAGERLHQQHRHQGAVDRHQLQRRTNVVRADSIYYLDADLRLKATSCTLATNLASCLIGAPGMDMNYFHDFSPGGSCVPNCGTGTNKDNRLLFAARPDPSIDVFDTFDGGQLLNAGVPVTIPSATRSSDHSAWRERLTPHASAHPAALRHHGERPRDGPAPDAHEPEPGSAQTVIPHPLAPSPHSREGDGLNRSREPGPESGSRAIIRKHEGSVMFRFTTAASRTAGAWWGSSRGSPRACPCPPSASTRS